jgi:hypothetical protein
MPVNMVDHDGNVVPVAEEQVQDAFRSGQYGFEQGARIPVAGDDGQIGSIDANQAQQAFGQDTGISAVSEETLRNAALQSQYGGAGGAAATFGINAGDALALGFGKGLAVNAADAFGGQEAADKTRQTIQGYDEANKKSAFAGQVVGTAAPLLAGGLPGLAGRGVRAVGSGVRAVDSVAALAEAGTRALVGEGAGNFAARAAQKGLAMGARGAVEGSIAGLGGAYSESVLQNEDLTAERLMAGAAHGAILGGAIGGTIGAGESLATTAATKFMDAVVPRIRDSLTDFAESRAFKAAGGSKTWVNKAMKRAGGAEEISKDLLARGHITSGSTVESIADSVTKDAEENGAKLGAMMKDLDAKATAAGVEKVDGGKIIRRAYDEVIEPMRANPAMRDVAEQLENRLKPYIDDFGGAPSKEAAEAGGLFGGRKAAMKGEGDVGALLERGKLTAPDAGAFSAAPAETGAKGVGFQQLWDIRRGLDQRINWETKAQSPLADGLKDFRRILEGELVDGADHTARTLGISDTWAKEWKETKRLYSSLAFARDMTQDAIAGKEGNRFFSLTDNLAGGFGAVASGGGLSLLHPGAAAAGVLTAAAHKIMRERGSSVLATAADKFSRWGSVAAEAHAVDQKVGAAVEKFLEAGKVTSRVTEAKVLDAAAGQLDSAAAGQAGVDPDKAVVHAVANVFGRESGTHPKGSIGHQFDQASRAVTALSANPAAVQAHMERSLAPITKQMPGVALKVATKQGKAIELLKSKLPPSSFPSPLSPHPVRTIGDMDKASFLRTLNAVRHPMAALDDLQSGRLSDEAAEVLREVYPEQLADLQQRVVEGVNELAAKGVTLSYEKRLQIGKLLNAPVDPTQDPMVVATVRDLYSQMGNAPQDPNQGGSPGGAATHVVDTAGALETKTDQLEKGLV